MSNRLRNSASAEIHKDFLQSLKDYGIPIGEALAKTLKSEKDETEVGIGTDFEIDRWHLKIDEYLERCPKEWEDEVWTGEIRPESLTEHTQEFVDWVMSIYPAFCRMKPYKPFYIYIRRMQEWMKDDDSYANHQSKAARLEFIIKERDRIRQNLAYGCNRYGEIAEGAIDTGSRRYTATLTHLMIIYLFQMGYPIYIGKGRQQAITSTYMLCMALWMCVWPQKRLKYIAEDDETGIEILDDKFKPSFESLPKWLRPEVKNDQKKLYVAYFNSKSKKGQKNVRRTTMRVVAPKKTAINGGSPDVAMVDEAGLIGIFNRMVKEARPTMFGEKDGKIVLKRQLVAWGTGGDNDKGKGDFERELKSLFAKWQNGDYSEKIIPIFLDWTCRPGITREFYEAERMAYLSGEAGVDIEDLGQEERLMQFRCHYPSSVEDMFNAPEHTVLPGPFILRQLDKIADTPHKMRPIYGRFEPEYDKSRPMPKESFLPYAVTGATFVPSDTYLGAPASMFLRPDKDWKYRYYQGTDPVMAKTGISKMASVIWDAKLGTIPCLVNYRTNDPHEAFLQTVLMGMYYSHESGSAVKELVESNIGSLYFEFKSGPLFGLRHTLVPNTMLPDYLQGGGAIWGVDTKAQRKDRIIRIFQDMSKVHGDKIYHEELFRQAKSYILTITQHGNPKWGPKSDQDRDDVIDAAAFAYLCRMCYQHVLPEHVGAEKHMVVPARRMVRKNGKLIWEVEREKQRVEVAA